MKFKVNVDLNLKVGEATDKVLKAARLAMRDTVVDIHGDSIKNAKSVGFWDTGYNARAIASEVSGMGVVLKGVDAKPEKVVDDNKLEGAVYSTSGYGGFGETGTVHMGAKPYFKPAMDKNVPNFPKRMKEHLP